MRRLTDVALFLRKPIPFLFLLLCACGGGEIDQEDELGKEESEEEGRYELVIVEAAQEDKRDSVQTTSTTREEPAVEDGTGRTAESIDPGQLVRFDPGGQFTVQVGAYKNSRIAGKIVTDLSGEGYPAYAIAGPDGKEIRVRIGYFKTRIDAERFGRIFKEDRGKDYWVDRRSNEK